MLLVACVSALSLSAKEQVTSPNGEVSLCFEIGEQGRPTYSVDYKTHKVVLPSGMGLELRGQDGQIDFGKEITRSGHGEPVSLYDGFELLGVERSTFDETRMSIEGELVMRNSRRAS